MGRHFRTWFSQAMVPVLLFWIVGTALPQVTANSSAYVETLRRKHKRPAAYAGSASCGVCHVEVAKHFSLSVHGRLADFETPGANRGCEVCHGPCGDHLKGKFRNVVKFRPAWGGGKNRVRETPEERAEIVRSEATCLECHKGGSHFNWRGGPHAMEDVTCIDCHKIHGRPSRHLLVKPEPGLCYGCHRGVQAAFHLPSHHPVRERKMVCSSCHAPHGSLVTGLKTDERLNDLCLKCHAAKQGPFAFEHEPVVERCVICHSPHGAVANNLLKQNEPFLCLQCHQFHFHTARSAWGNPGDVSVNPNIYGRFFTSQGPEGFRMAMATKCTQCHSQVHGSDLPAQSAMGLGQGLTR